MINVKDLKLMITKEEAKLLVQKDKKINPKELSSSIEKGLTAAHDEYKIIDGETENILANIKEDIIEAAYQGKTSITFPEINFPLIRNQVMFVLVIIGGYYPICNGNIITLNWG